MVTPWLVRLSAVLGTEVPRAALLDLAETEQLKERFFNIIATDKGLQRHVWTSQFRSDALRAVQQLRHVLPDTAVVLFSAADRYIGAPLVPCHAVLRNAEAVWKLIDYYDVCATPRSLEFGFCLEKNHIGRDCEYELASWQGTRG